MSVIKDGSVVISLEEFDRLRERDHILKSLEGKNFIFMNNKYYPYEQLSINANLKDFPEIEKDVNDRIKTMESKYYQTVDHLRDVLNEKETEFKIHIDAISSFSQKSLLKRIWIAITLKGFYTK